MPMKISPAGLARRVAMQSGTRYNTPAELMALEMRAREFLLMRRIVADMEAEAEERLHQSIMNSLDDGPG